MNMTLVVQLVGGFAIVATFAAVFCFLHAKCWEEVAETRLIDLEQANARVLNLNQALQEADVEIVNLQRKNDVMAAEACVTAGDWSNDHTALTNQVESLKGDVTVLNAKLSASLKLVEELEQRNESLFKTALADAERAKEKEEHCCVLLSQLTEYQKRDAEFAAEVERWLWNAKSSTGGSCDPANSCQCG